MADINIVKPYQDRNDGRRDQTKHGHQVGQGFHDDVHRLSGVHLVSMPLAASNSPIMVSGMSAVKPIVDLSRHRFRNAVDGFEVLEAGARH